MKTLRLKPICCAALLAFPGIPGTSLVANEIVPLNEFITSGDFMNNFTVPTGFTGLSVDHSSDDDGGIGRGGFVHVPPDTGTTSNLIYTGPGGPTFGDVTIAVDHDPVHSVGFIVRGNPARNDSIRVLFTNRARVRIWRASNVADHDPLGVLLYDQTDDAAREGWSHLRLDVRNGGENNDQIELVFRAYDSQVRFDETTLATEHAYTLSVEDSAPYLAPGEIGLRMINRGTRIDNFAVYEYGTAPASLAYPELVDFYPVPGTDFHAAEDGLNFRALSPAGIDPSDISVVLNGMDISGDLQISGDAEDRTVHYGNLSPDTDYVAEIEVIATSGEITTRRVEFRSEAPVDPVPLIDLVEFADEADFTDNFLIAQGSIGFVPDWDRGIGRGGFLRSSSNTNVMYDIDGVGDTQTFQDFTATLDRRAGASTAFILRGDRANDRSIRIMLSNRNRIRVWTNANITGAFGGDLIFDDSVPVGVPAGDWYHTRIDVRNIGEEWDRQIEIRYRAYASQNDLSAPGMDHTYVIPSGPSANHLEAGEVGFRVVGVGEVDNFGVYEYGKAPVWRPHPRIENISPAPGSDEIGPGDVFSFEVTGFAATPQSGIRVWFDDVEVSENLTFEGNERHWVVSYEDSLPGGSVFIEATNPGATTTAYFDYPVQPVPGPVRAGEVIWTNADAILGADRDGENLSLHATGFDRVIGIAVDDAARMLYFADDATGSVGRVGYDGSGRDDFLTDRENPQFVDLTADRVFWTEYFSGLWSADRDGGDVQQLVPLVEQAISGLTVDEAAGKVYFASAQTDGQLYRVNLDGSGLETLSHVTLISGTYGLALDSEQGLLYASNYNPSGSIVVHNLTTGAQTPLYTGRPHPLGLALSEDGSQLFWAERNDVAQITTSGRILTAPADGSGPVVELAGGLNSPFGIALVPFAVDGAFAEWIAQYDLPAGQTGPQDNPSGDGIFNFVKYALGADPTVADRGILPLFDVETDDGEDYLTLATDRNPDAVGVTLLVEVSPDLANWFSGPEHTTVLVDTASELVVRDNVPISAANRRFIRLSVIED